MLEATNFSKMQFQMETLSIKQIDWLASVVIDIEELSQTNRVKMYAEYLHKTEDYRSSSYSSRANRINMMPLWKTIFSAYFQSLLFLHGIEH